MAVKAVFFDVGETLVDETRQWGAWADWLGVPRFTFFAVLGAGIARGEHHVRAFDHFRPDFDLDAARDQRRREGWRDGFEPGDLYADAVPCLRALREQGYFVGIAGNQPVEAAAALEALGIPADLLATSAACGVAKPSPAFFERVLETAKDRVGIRRPGEVAYVGDHPRNDIAAAADAGLTTVFVRRGPWAIAEADGPDAARADIRLDSLAELPQALQRLGAAGGL